VATLLFVRALDDGSRRAWLLYAVAAAFAVYCHFYAGFVIAAHALSLCFAPNRPSRRRIVETALTFVALILGALYFTATASRGQLEWAEKPTWAMFTDVVWRSGGKNELLVLVTLAGLVLLAVRAWRPVATARWQLALVGGWTVLPFLFGVLVSFIQPIFTDRYLIVATPGISLAAALAIVALWRVRQAAALVLLAGVLALSLARIGHWYGRNTEDWRAAVAYVQQKRRPSDDVVVAPTWALFGLRFYDGSTEIS
jgi:mannosyltransferase